MAKDPSNPSFPEPAFEFEEPTKVPVNPITRRQKFLAAIARDAEPPEPITETEKLLYNIAITIMSLTNVNDPLVADNDLVVDNGDVTGTAN
jgi:hypothetical protein